MANEETQPLLTCRNVFKYFGGLAAVNDFDLDVFPGDVIGIGGPNGAGKTTFLDVISGISPATSGDIALNGTPIAVKKPDAICHLGISRTFQLNAGFETMSIEENTLVGASFGLGDKGWFPRMTYNRQMRERVEKALVLCNLQDKADMVVRDLPVLDRKLLMLAGALATEPKLLLVDEPVGGLNPHEVDDVMEIVQGLIKEGVTIILIEHVMRFLLQLSKRVVIMHHGEKIYEGDSQGLLNDRKVVEVYLGEGTADRLQHMMEERAKNG